MNELLTKYTGYHVTTHNYYTPVTSGFSSLKATWRKTNALFHTGKLTRPCLTNFSVYVINK
jgi:hypothetical protein